MPHKHNPVLAELVVPLARFNATLVSGMHQAVVHEQERSDIAWALEWMILPRCMWRLARLCRLQRKLCRSPLKWRALRTIDRLGRAGLSAGAAQVKTGRKGRNK